MDLEFKTKPPEKRGVVRLCTNFLPPIFSEVCEDFELISRSQNPQKMVDVLPLTKLNILCRYVLVNQRDVYYLQSADAESPQMKRQVCKARSGIP